MYFVFKYYSISKLWIFFEKCFLYKIKHDFGHYILLAPNSGQNYQNSFGVISSGGRVGSDRGVAVRTVLPGSPVCHGFCKLGRLQIRKLAKRVSLPEIIE